MYKFDLEDYAGTYRNVCKTMEQLKAIGATVINNTNGEVEVYLKNGNPYTDIRNKECCERLGYKFDIEKQKCYWKTPSSSSCNDDCVKKVVFNSNKSKGSLFKINEGETCTLDISFDYLINFDCTLFKSTCSNNQDEINSLENELKRLKRQYDTTLSEATFNSNILNQTQQEFNNLPYVIKGMINSVNYISRTQEETISTTTTTTRNTPVIPTTTTNGTTTTTTPTTTTTNTDGTTTTTTNTDGTTTTTTKNTTIDTWRRGSFNFGEEVMSVDGTTNYGDGITPIINKTIPTTTTTNTPTTPRTINRYQTPIDVELNTDFQPTTTTTSTTTDTTINRYQMPVDVEYNTDFQPSITTYGDTPQTFGESKPYNVILPLGLDYSRLTFKYDTINSVSTNNTDLPPTLFGFYLYGKKAYSAVASTNSLTPKVYLLNRSGLEVWSNILGPEKYKKFIDNYGCDETQYTQTNFNDFIANVFKESSANNMPIPNYYVETTQGVCDKKIKNDELNRYKLLDSQYKTTLTNLNNQINELTNRLNTLKSVSSYSDTLKNLENIKITFVLEHDNNNNVYSSVYEETLFNIGENNMMNFIDSKSPNTGIIISGATSNGLLTPPYSWPALTNLNIKSDSNYNCELYRDEFIKTLYLERYKGNYPEPTSNQEQIELTKKLNSWYNSTWVNYNVSIPNETIEKIKNTKIRFSILVESCCIDLCFLIDKINFNKYCNSVDNEEITITKPIGFEVEKVMDNKKSWSVGDGEIAREFDLTFRETQYNANDYKLILNTKEIELKIDGSNAIEEDILCSIQSNSCLLTGSTYDLNSIEVNNIPDFESIFLNTIPSEYEPYSGYMFTSVWTITAKNNCETLYEDIFFNGSGNLLLDLIPTSESYKEILETVSNILNLDITHSGSTSIIRDNTNTRILINGFVIDIKLDLTISCYVVEANTCEDTLGLCDVNGVTYDIVFNQLDLMDDIRFIPTCEELENYPCDNEELSATYRSLRDSYFSNINNSILSGITHGITDFSGLSTYNSFVQFWDYINTDEFVDKSFYKGPLKRIKYKRHRLPIDYSEWYENIEPIDLSLDDVFSAMTGDFRYIPSVYDISLALEGNVGDLVYVSGTTNETYYWSPIENNWLPLESPTEIIGGALIDFIDTRREYHTSYLSRKNNLLLSLKPFLWAANYLPSFQIKKYFI